MLSLSPEQNCLSYFDSGSHLSCQAAVHQLETHVLENGPYDAVMAFSEGAAVASTFILAEQLKDRQPFRLAIFFCGVVPANPLALERNSVQLLTGESGELPLINIHTVHVFGAKDTMRLECGGRLSLLCQGNLKTEIIHGGGHEIPGRKMPDIVKRVLAAIREARDYSTTCQSASS
jgi:hypothetical protein